MPALGLGLNLRLALECNVCGRDRDEAEAALAEALLFGLSDPYALCPICFRETAEPLRSNLEYRRRVRMAYFSKFGRVLRS